MADDRIREWASALEAADMAAFARARSRFLRRPSSKRLHALRRSARNLRSLYDDLRDVLHCPYRKRLDRLIELTGQARDAGVLRALLIATTDTRNSDHIRALMRAFRKHERLGRKRILRYLARIRVK